MGPGMFAGLDKLFEAGKVFFVFSIVCVYPLAFWKLLDIVYYFYSHLYWK